MTHEEGSMLRRKWQTDFSFPGCLTLEAGEKPCAYSALWPPSASREEIYHLTGGSKSAFSTLQVFPPDAFSRLVFHIDIHLDSTNVQGPILGGLEITNTNPVS